jgi:hypothetical protein
MASFAELQRLQQSATSAPSTAQSNLLTTFFSPVSGTPIPGTDFVTLSAPAPRAICMVYGRDGSGKSTFAARFAPGPVAFINLDGRAEHTVYESIVEHGRVVHYMSTGAPADVLNTEHEELKVYAADVLNKIKRNFTWAVEQSRQGKVRTIVIDTTKELADLVKLAVRGRVDRPAGTKEDKGDFGKSDAVINRELWFFPTLARQSNANLVLIARSKPKYVGREDTGKVLPDTDKVFTAAVDWIAEIRLASVEEKQARLAEANNGQVNALQLIQIAQAGPSFEVEISEKAGTNHSELNKVYSESDWKEHGPFAYTCARMYKSTTVEDWK